MADSDADGGIEGIPAKKARNLSIHTVQKWITENEKELATTTWLSYEPLGRDNVAALKCTICALYEEKLISTRNFNRAFIDGCTNLRSSAFKEHASSSMHQKAMVLYKKSKCVPITEYAPIAKALSTLDASTEVRVTRKFEIAYAICKEGFAFTKMSALCELQEKHGVDLGSGYKNNIACTEFVHYIGMGLRMELVAKLAKAKFFSIQADGSTDAGRIDDELFLVLFLDPHSEDGVVHVHDKFLTVRRPKHCNADGLYRCFERGLAFVGINDWRTKLVGFGCDGTNVNIAPGGVRGFLEESVPWVVVFWCYAHRVELALKDAFKDTLLSTVDEMLLRLYYLYEKSPKKCRELDDVISALKSYLEPREFPEKGGNIPLRACGTRWVSHKVVAISRFLERYGAYIAHLITLTEDPAVKSTDKQKLKGYILQWRDAKMVLGCALFHDVLSPAAALCKVLQNDELCIVSAVEAILRCTKAIEKVKTTMFENLPTVSKVLGRMKHGTSHMYQDVELSRYNEAVTFLQNKKNEYTDSAVASLKERIQDQHTTLLSDVLLILATQGWGKSDYVELSEQAVERLTIMFIQPLEKAGAVAALFREEWIDMVEYGKLYLNLVEDGYRSVWWKLFNAADAKKWANILVLIELLFCLPVSNGRVERMFSSLKLIKTDRRSCLGEDTLDDLMRISVDGPPLAQWTAKPAVELWWKDKARRSVQDERAPPRPTCSTSVSTTQDDPYTLDINDWDSFLAV